MTRGPRKSTKPRKPQEPKWISKRAALAIHEQLLAAHGGAQGFVDASLLDSALASPQNHFAYNQSDVFELAAIYAHALTQAPPFVDGNKRVAFTIAATFLERSGLCLAGSEPEAVQIILDLSSQRADATDFARWLRGNSKPSAPTRTRTKKLVRVRVAKKK